MTLNIYGLDMKTKCTE